MSRNRTAYMIVAVLCLSEMSVADLQYEYPAPFLQCQELLKDRTPVALSFNRVYTVRVLGPERSSTMELQNDVVDLKYDGRIGEVAYKSEEGTGDKDRLATVYIKARWRTSRRDGKGIIIINRPAPGNPLAVLMSGMRFGESSRLICRVRPGCWMSIVESGVQKKEGKNRSSGTATGFKMDEMPDLRHFKYP